MKPTKIVTALLVAAMIASPIRLESQEDKDSMLFGGAMLALGGVIVLGLYYVSKRLPPPPGQCLCGCKSMTCGCPATTRNPPVTMLPPAGVIVTNPAALTAAAPVGKLAYESYAPIGSGSFVDGQGQPWHFDNAFSFALQSSVDLTNWSYALTLNGWLITEGGILWNVTHDGATLATVYHTNPLNTTNSLPLDLPQGEKRFYRIACQ